ncbi:hypothetical protein WL48_11175 [Burkholderia ubonensis]|uniref:FimD/PapC C-terminal domain-containing protein n=1 Tax=Burkholderia ubonensis TaxID=101571 RepID=UPI00075E96F1|nr:FimD/PapC C-terminal domain-containing protein [Burkholderia ubonensis]KWC40137.1 hypothetical protein WL48_11175 [Burkholderia ubonensis]
MQINVARADGQAMPFAASPQDGETGKQQGIVDPGGNALVLVDREQGTLTASGRTGSAKPRMQYRRRK